MNFSLITKKVYFTMFIFFYFFMSCNSSTIKQDEIILFYPTYAYYVSNNQDKIILKTKVHGKIYEPEYDSVLRASLIALLQLLLNMDNHEISQSQVFEERIRPFLVDNERNKSINITVMGKTYYVGTSKPNGHFSKEITFKIDRSSLKKTLAYKAVLSKDDSRQFIGKIHIISPKGLAIISDIDDTIKQTNVKNLKEMLKNTFIRPFKPVKGMSALYQDWQTKQRATFYYVSGSPWQLYEPLSRFMNKHHFPEGSFYLKQFRLKDRSLIKFLTQNQFEYKTNIISQIISKFPNKQFVLIGDSGEKDPEVYVHLAKNHSNIIAVFIRDLELSSQTNQSRYDQLLKTINRKVIFKAFTDPDELLKIDLN